MVRTSHCDDTRVSSAPLSLFELIHILDQRFDPGTNAGNDIIGLLIGFAQNYISNILPKKLNLSLITRRKQLDESNLKSNLQNQQHGLFKKVNFGETNQKGRGAILDLQRVKRHYKQTPSMIIKESLLNRCTVFRSVTAL